MMNPEDLRQHRPQTGHRLSGAEQAALEGPTVVNRRGGGMRSSSWCPGSPQFPKDLEMVFGPHDES